MEKQFIPNSTQTPNIFYDWIFPNIGEADLKCLAYIVRRTYGFHKDHDLISLSQFVNGIKNRDGNQLDCGCGLTRPAVVGSLKILVESKLVKQIRTLGGNRYGVNTDLTLDKTATMGVVNQINHLRKLYRTGKISKPKQGRLMPRKTNSEKKVKVCETLKKWNDNQSSPVPNFKPENIVNKHGADKVEQLINYFGRQNNGFPLFLNALKS